MGKFNQSTKGTNTTTNLAGGTSYKIHDKRKALALQLVTCFVNEPKFYGNNTTDIVKSVREMLEYDAQFIANVAIYCRKELYLRSVVHMLVGELAFAPKGKVFVRQTLAEVVERVDDMTEIMAYYINTYKKPLPNSLKKGIADCLLKFDEYALSKYNRDGQVKLKDLVLLTHPKPKNEEQSILMKKILDDTLETPVTWEVILSAKDGRTKKEKWEQLIDGRNLGYMATLRNVRNVLENCDDVHIDKVLSYLTNENAVRNSKQMPFRYYSCYREIQNNYRATSKVLDAIETALELSAKNLPTLKGKTMFISDVSGSMDNSLSKDGSITYKNVGTLLMSIAQRFCEDSITSVFASEFKVVNASTKNGIIANMQAFERESVGYNTYLFKALKWMIANKVKVDRIVVFSDMQCYRESSFGREVQSLLDEYKMFVNPDVFLHSVDLAGYQSSSIVMEDKKVNLVAGWSDKVLGYISMVEQGTSTLVEKIKTYYFN